MVAGTKAETVIAIIEKIPHKHQNQVTEITLIWQQIWTHC
jgi:hypothetical protein